MNYDNLKFEEKLQIIEEIVSGPCNSGLKELEGVSLDGVYDIFTRNTEKLDVAWLKSKFDEARISGEPSLEGAATLVHRFLADLPAEIGCESMPKVLVIHALVALPACIIALIESHQNGCSDCSRKGKALNMTVERFGAGHRPDLN